MTSQENQQSVQGASDVQTNEQVAQKVHATPTMVDLVNEFRSRPQPLSVIANALPAFCMGEELGKHILKMLHRMPSVMSSIHGKFIGKAERLHYRMDVVIPGQVMIICLPHPKFLHVGSISASMVLSLNEQGLVDGIHRIMYCEDPNERHPSQWERELRADMDALDEKLARMKPQPVAEPEPAPVVEQPAPGLPVKAAKHKGHPHAGALAAIERGQMVWFRRILNNEGVSVKGDVLVYCQEHLNDGISPTYLPESFRWGTVVTPAQMQTALDHGYHPLGQIFTKKVEVAQQPEEAPVQGEVAIGGDMVEEDVVIPELHQRVIDALAGGSMAWFAPLPEEDDEAAINAGIVYCQHHLEKGFTPSIGAESFAWGVNVSARMLEVAYEFDHVPVNVPEAMWEQIKKRVDAKAAASQPTPGQIEHGTVDGLPRAAPRIYPDEPRESYVSHVDPFTAPAKKQAFTILPD